MCALYSTSPMANVDAKLSVSQTCSCLQVLNGLVMQPAVKKTLATSGSGINETVLMSHL